MLMLGSDKDKVVFQHYQFTYKKLQNLLFIINDKKLQNGFIKL